MGASVEIRKARAEDYEPWWELYAEVAAEGRWIGGEQAPPEADRRERFTSGLSDPDRLQVVADADEAGLAGVLSCNFGRVRVAEFGMLLGTAWRGQGIGSQLLTRCIEWCREKECHKVALEVWPHNEPAIALYRKFGFEVEGRKRRHYRRRSGELWDSLEMGLILDHDSPGSPHPEAPNN